MKYVHSRGFIVACDIKPPVAVSSQRISYNIVGREIESGATVYVCSSAIPHFRATQFARLPASARIVLVSGDCDESVPYDIFKSPKDFYQFIEDPRIIHWFVQNACVVHPKLTQIPIGLDYHTLAERRLHEWGARASPEEQETQLAACAARAPPLSERTLAGYANFKHAIDNRKFAGDRKEALAAIPPELIFVESEPIPRVQTWEAQARFAFVYSPLGGGLDCHRTWEALVLGCIPILHSSPLDPMFEGLPVLCVKAWSDVTAELLRETRDKWSQVQWPTELSGSRKLPESNHLGFAQAEKLQMSYWLGLIEAARGRSARVEASP